MGPFAVAWLIGQSIVIYRWARLKAPPPPGALVLPSVVFIGLAVVAEYQPARTAATVAAFGVDLAVLLQVLGKAPQGASGWPPPLINDPSVILPPGTQAVKPAKGGQAPNATPDIGAKAAKTAGGAA